MLDFVILYHEMPDDRPRTSHWDLMLRQGDHLLTWALAANPLQTEKSLGERLSNHRLEYLTYEGPVSDDRGSVKAIGRGCYEILDECSVGNPIAWSVVLRLGSGELLEVRCGRDSVFEFIYR